MLVDRLLGEFGERRLIAEHAVDPFDHDQLALALIGEARQAPIQVLGIVMAEAHHRRAAEPAAVIDARMRVGIHENDVAGTREAGQHAQVRLVSGGEHQRATAMHETGDLTLELRLGWARASIDDALVMELAHWEPILEACRRLFPRLRRVSCYATATNVADKRDAELARLRELGLSLLYMGPESGDDETLKKIAVELTQKLRASVTVDWSVRETVRARLRVMVKTLLNRTFEAAAWAGANSIGIAGGVSANSRLRRDAAARGQPLHVALPIARRCTE